MAAAVDITAATAVFPSSSTATSNDTQTDAVITPLAITTSPASAITTATPTTTVKSAPPSITPAKRGYKSHVPSACINCKKAHLACDVSRPCKRCVSMGKTDTCQDIKHKKRGRPKLRDKRSNGSGPGTGNKYGAIYGNNNIQIPNSSVTSSTTTADFQQSISFIHEPIESFQDQNRGEDRLSVSASLATSQLQPAVVRLSTTPQITRPAPLALQPATFPIQPYPTVTYTTPLPLQAYASTAAAAAAAAASVIPHLPPTSLPPTPLEPLQVMHSFEGALSPPRASPNSVKEDQRVVILFLSMEVCCARISDEVLDLWGYYPQELAHRSLYDFISSKDSDRLSRLHRLLLDNVLDVAKQSDPSYDISHPPPTERSTSELFHCTDPVQLAMVANGSSRFSDTLHIKKRSGELELFEIVAYMGGGFGADLFITSSLSRLYIVAEFKKHCYEVSAKTAFHSTCTPWSFSSKFGRTTTMAASTTTSAASPSPSSASVSTSFSAAIATHDLTLFTTSTSTTTSASASTTSTTNKTIDMPTATEGNTSISMSHPSRHLLPFHSSHKHHLNKPSLLSSRPISDLRTTTSHSWNSIGPRHVAAPHDLRQYSLPTHFTVNSHLNTVSFPKLPETPKVNVAPITSTTAATATTTTMTTTRRRSSSSSNGSSSSHSVSHVGRRSLGQEPSSSSSSSSSSSFSSSTWAPIHPILNSVSNPMARQDSSNPYSTLAYRFASSAAVVSGPGVPRGGDPSVTHPTQQYFLQTSSSTLNAAASAAQVHSRLGSNSSRWLDNNSDRPAEEDTAAGNDRARGKTDSNRKVGMSIRSLLC
ncbi:hypothetical protein EC973_007896 [Apophysomyces ossiformis]|uniref:Zn(2)-C6 fungal-type domain-containing protein n=1 Tax=Apophysomyces ossiformis TaxID=679940 RepID=A0A8H7BP96_9FUNG|nr:hypothetical protein EC973_007896 [Apophysomyces ossiformis]